MAAKRQNSSGSSRKVAPPPPPLGTAPLLRLLYVAGLAVLLGLALEALLLAAASISGALPDAAPFFADAVRQILWSWIVCTGLSAGGLLTPARPAGMALGGLLLAPFADWVARAAYGIVAGALGVSVGRDGLAIAAWRALEYAVLGFALGHLAQRRVGASAYLVAGLGVGLLFGIPALWLDSGPPAGARTVEELAFPVLCGMVLYAAEVLATRHR